MDVPVHHRNLYTHFAATQPLRLERSRPNRSCSLLIPRSACATGASVWRRHSAEPDAFERTIRPVMFTSRPSVSKLQFRTCFNSKGARSSPRALRAPCVPLCLHRSRAFRTPARLVPRFARDYRVVLPRLLQSSDIIVCYAVPQPPLALLVESCLAKRDPKQHQYFMFQHQFRSVPLLGADLKWRLCDGK